ncbi:hypothetical protein R4Z09_26240 [Niallia oryzisoli]|uniref:Glycosyltransferase n=1 Tax=Niallia oryzisoli TaxID=1737571 RepID=A0ABZ2CFZ0_9BACI
MRIAYVVAESLEKEHGVSKKIYNQIKFWISEGHQVRLFYFSNKSLNPLFTKLDYQIVRYQNRVDFVLNLKYFSVIQEWSPEIIYFRRYLYSRTFSKMLKVFPGIIEINTDDIEETKLTFPLVIRMFHKFTRELLFKKATGFVCVTHELRKKWMQYSSNVITISNGINGSYIGKQVTRQSNKRFQVLFLGSPNQSWHGLDKIKFLAENLPDIDFHIIGTQELKNSPVNLKQYGYLNEVEYLGILNQCDVSIGTLALHRKKMMEACPLKTREYLKYGLPTIVGYQDSDFLNKNTEFLMHLPNEENNVKNNIKEIKEFIESSRNTIIKENDVRHIFNEYKEKERLEFMMKSLNKM